MDIHTNGSSQGDMIAELARLRAENESLRAKAKARAASRLHLKVSDKGAVSLYGMGKWPVTLYKGQWEVLLDNIETIKDFIKDNDHLLKVKE